jgi:uncharacterized protein
VRRRAFAVSVAPILRHGVACQSESRSGPIPNLVVCGSMVPEGVEVGVDVRIEAAHPGVMVSGVVSAAWVGECRRCLGPAGGQIRAHVRELYESDGDPETTYLLEGEQVDFEAMARDAILCELPLAPLCQPGCRGLCPACGGDRNLDACRCTSPIDSNDPVTRK